MSPTDASESDVRRRDEAVTIVIPTFNDASEHLFESVASATGQTWENLEVVVVNDGSTSEDTLDALQDIEADPGVTVLHKPNGGVGSARNVGIERAAGEIIICLDADDRLDRHYVAEAVSTLRDPDVVVAFPFCRTFGAAVGEQPTAPEVSPVDAVRGSGIFPPSAFRRSRWRDIGGFFEGDPAVQEDWEFWTRVLRDGGIGRRVPSAVFHWRIRAGSRSSIVHISATRSAMVQMNAGHEGTMLALALEGLDQAQAKVEVQKAELAVWQRRVAPLRALLRSTAPVRSAVRRFRRGPHGEAS